MIRIFVLAISVFGIVFSAQMSAADVSWTQQQRPVIHKVTGDETLWFIAQVYYKKGENYKKIMAANGLKTPESVKQGAMLVIPNPLFSNHAKDFQARYDFIHKIREDKFSAMISTARKTTADYQAEVDASVKERQAIEEQMKLKDTDRAQKRGVASIIEKPAEPVQATAENTNNEKTSDSETSSVRRFVAE